MAVKTLVAALTIAMDSDSAVPDGHLLIFPEGDAVKAGDGRPHGIAGWKMLPENGVPLAASLNNFPIDKVIDYEHATILSKKTGAKAPAAGWMKKGEYVYIDGVGLCSKNVEFTKTGQEHLDEKEYKYFSPVIFHKADGTVVGLHSSALTNDPGLTMLDPITLSALSAEIEQTDSASFSTHDTKQEDNTMNPELKALLCSMLGLADDADDAAMLTALTSAKDTVSDKLGIDLTAEDKDITALASHVVGQIAAAEPDPAQFVPITALHAANAKIAELAGNQKSEVDDLITQALSDGRLQPAQKDWAKKLGDSDLTALTGYLNTAPKIGAFSGKQSKQVKDDDGGQQAELSSDQVAMAEMFGNDPKEVAALMREGA